MFRAFSRSTDFSFRLLCCAAVAALVSISNKTTTSIQWCWFFSQFLCKAFTFSFFCISYFSYTQLTQCTLYCEPQQKTLEAAWKKIQLCARESEWARERRRRRWWRRRIVEWEKELNTYVKVYVYINVQKSHFYSCSGPLPPCSFTVVAACLLNALVSAECLSAVSSEIYFTNVSFHDKPDRKHTQTTARLSHISLYVYFFNYFARNQKLSTHFNDIVNEFFFRCP